MTGEEIFSKIYNQELDQDECIKILNSYENRYAYIFRLDSGNFDFYELMQILLIKDYKFEIVNQDVAEEELRRLERKRRIKQLEKELKELKLAEEEDK